LYYDYEYVDIPFDDTYIKGNGGHRFGLLSTTLQNQVFTFPGFRKINPINFSYSDLKSFDLSSAPNGYSHVDIKNIVDSCESQLILLNNFSKLFIGEKNFYDRLRLLPILDPSVQASLYRPKDVLKLVVHIRRGDIMRHDFNSHRIMPLEYFNNLVGAVELELRKNNIKYNIHLHCEDDVCLDFDYIRYSSESPIDSFLDICSADIVISSKSAHSIVPCFLNGCLHLYPEDSWLPICSDWFVVSKNSTFDISKFNDSLLRFVKD
jgi:hypothetical protein